MKKPNITEGEWVVSEEFDNQKTVAAMDGKYTYWVAICYNKPNAKAISAVPDMIDALIVAYLQIDDMPIGDRKERHLIVYNKLADALERAGVEL